MRLRVLAAVFLAAVAGCATVLPPSTAESRREARLSHASTGLRCADNTLQPKDQSCVDEQGLVWSACAWNSCGLDHECRRSGEVSVMTGSCGGPEWLSCDVPVDERKAAAMAEVGR